MTKGPFINYVMVSGGGGGGGKNLCMTLLQEGVWTILT